MLAKLSPRSILLVLVSAIFGRAATALSQVIAAIYLSPTDFGIYATASGFMLVTTALRAGGSGNHFPTMTLEEFDRDGPRIFRYSLRFIALGLILSAIFVWPVSNWFARNQNYPATVLLSTAAVLAGNFILFNVACYPRCYMLARGRIKELSAMESVMGTGKLACTWGLAAAGEGQLALAFATLASEGI
ncbi:MAG: lipopolysaccharide biosynthesis protein, partial [Planctomycetota bacterium]